LNFPAGRYDNGMYLLYLDDSGKIHPNDTTTDVVTFGGFAIHESNWHRLNRQINGAKSKLLPTRGTGDPNSWEVKSIDFLTVNSWQRAKNRRFCKEIANILQRNSCIVYAVSLDKRNAKDQLLEEKFVPLMLQRLSTVFYRLLEANNSFGSIVCDWSTHHMDNHISRCITSMSISEKMHRLIGGVTYGSSTALPMLQVADLIASAFRREGEGQSHVKELTDPLRCLEYLETRVQDEFGFASTVRGIIKVF
jgi:hypothetical protein